VSKKFNKDVAKRIAEEAFDIRRELQFNEMMEWRAGEQTGMEALEKILDHEKVIIVQQKFDHYRKQIALLQQKHKGKK